MAVAEVGTPTATTYTALTTSGTTAITNTFSGTQPRTAGHLLWAIVTVAIGGTIVNFTPPATPSGWTAASGGSITGAGGRTWVGHFWKVAAGSDAAPSFSVTGISSTTAGRGSVTLHEFSGANTTTPVDTAGTYDSGSAATITTVTVTSSGNVTSSGEFAVVGQAMAATSTAATKTYTVGSGFTNFSNDGATSTQSHAANDTKSNPTSGTTSSDAASWTSTTLAYASAAIVVIAVQASTQTRTAALTVTPAFSATAITQQFVTAALTVTPAFSATPFLVIKYRTAALAVTPSFSTTTVALTSRTAALTITPSFHAAPLVIRPATAALTITPAFGGTAAEFTAPLTLLASASPFAGSDVWGNTFLAGITAYVIVPASASVPAGIYAVNLGQFQSAAGFEWPALVLTNLTSPSDIPPQVFAGNSALEAVVGLLSGRLNSSDPVSQLVLTSAATAGNDVGLATLTGDEIITGDLTVDQTITVQGAATFNDGLAANGAKVFANAGLQLSGTDIVSTAAPGPLSVPAPAAYSQTYATNQTTLANAIITALQASGILF